MNILSKKYRSLFEIFKKYFKNLFVFFCQNKRKLFKFSGNEDNDAQKDTLINSEKNSQENRLKIFFLQQFIFIFILGLLLGGAIKIEALNSVAIGFEDYKMKIKKRDYDINLIQKEVFIRQIDKARNESRKNNNNDYPSSINNE